MREAHWRSEDYIRMAVSGTGNKECKLIFLHGEGPRSKCYGSITALRLFVQPYDEDEQFFLPSFTSNGAPVE
jgi:hypothetical protein